MREAARNLEGKPAAPRYCPRDDHDTAAPARKARTHGKATCVPEGSAEGYIILDSDDALMISRKKSDQVTICIKISFLKSE